MATITLKGKTIHTIGELPKVDTRAPDFILTKTDFTEISSKDILGKKVVLNIFPSIDTSTCAMSVRQFNEKATQLDNVLVLCVSADLPFALKRFCGAENLTHVIPVSVFRHTEFGKKYGVTITEGPLAGLLARAIVVLDDKSNVVYTEQVAEIASEPNYDAALSAIR